MRNSLFFELLDVDGGGGCALLVRLVVPAIFVFRASEKHRGGSLRLVEEVGLRLLRAEKSFENVDEAVFIETNLVKESIARCALFSATSDTRLAPSLLGNHALARFTKHIFFAFVNTIQEQVFQLTLFLELDGLLEIDTNDIRVTEKGKPFVRNICMAFDLLLQEKKPETQLFSMTI